MNVNTTTNTFHQLMGSGLSYCVPPFQRNYSWGADEWDDLWQDIVGLFGEDPEPAHHMGYLVLQSSDNREFNIIDGQQRIATLSLLMLAAVSHLTDLAVPGDLNDPQYRRAQQFRHDYIDYLDPVNLVVRSKLTLNRQNDGFYQNYLIPLERQPQVGLNDSEHLLCQAFIFFKERVKKHSNGNGKAVARFVGVVVHKLFFTVTTVTDELNAFKVFETMNARGLYLSTSDLLKNYLFSVISRRAACMNRNSRHWKIVGKLSLGCWVVKVFQSFCMCSGTAEIGLYARVTCSRPSVGAVNNRDKAFALIRDMDRYARVYTALCRPEDSLWAEKERDNLAQLRMFSVRQPLAVLMAVYNRFAEDDRAGFGRFLRAIAVVSFRYNVICGRQSNEQEGVYNQIACGISEGRIDSIAAAIAALRPVYPGDGEFRTAFSNKALRTSSSRNKKIARFILVPFGRAPIRKTV